MPTEIAEGITTDPRIMVGKPVIKGTRMPVELIIAKLAANPDLNELFLDYPELTVRQVQDCLKYAARLVQDTQRSPQANAAAGAPHVGS